MEHQKVTRTTQEQQQRTGHAFTEAEPSARAVTHPVLQLQRMIGNQGVQRLIQAKLQVDQPSDKSEQEASWIANQVLSGGATKEALPLQRKCGCDQHTLAGDESEECRQKREGNVQRAAVSPVPVNAVPPIVYDVLNSPARPLDAETKAFMESRFGLDFSQVGMHTDAQAAESARAVNAQAYTVGRDMVFGAGRYAPKTSEGKRLMAHELTHVVQQGSSQTVAPQVNLEINRSGDLSEKEADEVSSQVISSAHPLMQRHFVTPSSLLQRQEASTSVNPPLASVDPGIAKVPWIRYVDLFDQVVYDLSYRRKGGSSSTWLKVYYPDGAIIDINIDDIIEESMTSENARNAMAQGHIGIGGRIFPQVMNPRTTPRLWKAKQEALEIMDEETRELIQLALPAVMFVITVSMSTIRGPEPGEELPLSSKRSRVPRQSGGSTAAVKGEGESAPPTTSKGGGGVKQVSPEGTEATPAATSQPSESPTSPTVTRPTVAAPRVESGLEPPMSKLSIPGYQAGEGEVIGEVPEAQRPAVKPGTTPYGRAMEPLMEPMVKQRFPNTQFRFRTGPGETGVDIEWIGGEDPGFDIADFKPGTPSGVKKFTTQTGKWGARGWESTTPRPETLRAAFIGYNSADGTVYIGHILHIH